MSAGTAGVAPPAPVAYPAYSLWLLPREEQAEQLADIVARLAPRFSTRAFMPHVTVQGDLQYRLKDVVAVAQQLASAQAPMRCDVRGIAQSDHYYRAFYLALDDADGAFARMCASAAQAFATRDGLSPFAHLSLAYGTLDGATKDALAQEIAAGLPAALELDRIAVSLSGSGVGIASWRILQSFPLAGAPAHTREST